MTNLISGGNSSIYVSSLAPAIQYYTEGLGLRLKVRMGDEWAELDAGEGLIIGLHPARPPATVPAGTPGATNIELKATRPLEEVVAALAKKGVRFTGPIQDYPNVRLVTLADPDGNALFLAEVLHSTPARSAPI